jgi:hypothetical protein
MVVKRVGPLSCAKICGLLNAVMGLLIGAIFSLVSMVIGSVSQEAGGQFFGVLFGVGAVVVLPIFYGCMGFVVTLLAAALYNFAAGIVGGIEIEIESVPPQGTIPGR